jgi:hypothetical protein
LKREGRMKVVFDTNVLISATLWDKSVSQKLLFKLIQENIQIFSSVEILSEYQKVLERDFEYSPEQISYKLGVLVHFLKIIETNRTLEIIKEDPTDNRILECAIDSYSDYIITYDKHLLKIRTIGEIKIRTPEEMLGILSY